MTVFFEEILDRVANEGLFLDDSALIAMIDSKLRAK
jgi:hypothetical protein